MAQRVSVIVPARNEAAHIEACLRSILAQVVQADLEVIVADGNSSDGTADMARSLGVTVVENPKGTTPAGLNAALAAATGEIVVRFDGHGTMPPGYVNASVRALEEEPGAVGAGGWIEVEANGPWGRAIGSALASRFGIGNPRSWRRPRPGQPRMEVDTFPLGCWPTEKLRGAGGWDERLLRNQDFELNYRLRSAGGRLVYDPAIWSFYRPRESLWRLARQYWDYGRFKALTVATAAQSLRPRQLAPVALLATIAAAPLPIAIAGLARMALAGYGVLLAGVAARNGGGWRTVPVLATIHAVWGAGLVFGLGQIAASSARGWFLRHAERRARSPVAGRQRP